MPIRALSPRGVSQARSHLDAFRAAIYAHAGCTSTMPWGCWNWSYAATLTRPRDSNQFSNRVALDVVFRHRWRECQVADLARGCEERFSFESLSGSGHLGTPSWPEGCPPKTMSVRTGLSSSQDDRGRRKLRYRELLESSLSNHCCV